MIVEIVIFLNMLICFVVPLLIFFLIGERGEKNGLTFLLGASVYFLGEQLCKKYFIEGITFITKYEPYFWSHKIRYGMIMGISTGIFSELVRFCILSFFHKVEKWLLSVRRNTLIGLGQGWSTGIFMWGLYNYQLAQKHIQGESVGITLGELCTGTVERISATVLFIGLTYLLQYGIAKRDSLKYFMLVAMIHSTAEMGLYFFPYVFHIPVIITQLLYVALAIWVFWYGYKTIVPFYTEELETEGRYL